jgi:hypothetical protein
MSKQALEKLKKQQTIIARRIQKLTAKEQVTERNRDIRRKILVGAYYLDQAKVNNEMEKIRDLMVNYLTRDSDKKLFDLPPLPDSALSNE